MNIELRFTFNILMSHSHYSECYKNNSLPDETVLVHWVE